MCAPSLGSNCQVMAGSAGAQLALLKKGSSLICTAVPAGAPRLTVTVPVLSSCRRADRIGRRRPDTVDRHARARQR